jgi:hypothetical protein
VVRIAKNRAWRASLASEIELLQLPECVWKNVGLRNTRIFFLTTVSNYTIFYKPGHGALGCHR